MLTPPHLPVARKIYGDKPWSRRPSLPSGSKRPREADAIGEKIWRLKTASRRIWALIFSI